MNERVAASFQPAIPKSAKPKPQAANGAGGVPPVVVKHTDNQKKQEHQKRKRVSDLDVLEHMTSVLMALPRKRRLQMLSILKRNCE